MKNVNEVLLRKCYLSLSVRKFVEYEKYRKSHAFLNPILARKLPISNITL